MGKKKRTAKGARALQMDAENVAFEEGELLASERWEERVEAMKKIAEAPPEDHNRLFGSAPITIGHSFSAALGSSAVKERGAAADALCVMMLSCEDIPDEALENVLPAIETQLAAQQAEPAEYEGVAKVLKLLGVYAYVHMETKEILELMDMAMALLEQEQEESGVQEAAAQCIARMCLGVPPADLAVAVIPNYLRVVSDALFRCETCEARLHIGTLLAVMVMQYRLFVQEDGEASDDEDEMYACNDLAGMVDHRELVQEVEALANDSSRVLSKAEKSRQRKHFKMVLGTLRELDEPDVELELRHQQFTVEGWSGSVALDMIREVFGPTTMEHVCEKAMLQDMLGISVDSSYRHQRLSKLEKRVYRGANARAHKRQRGQERQDKVDGGHAAIAFTTYGDE